MGGYMSCHQERNTEFDDWISEFYTNIKEYDK